MFHDRTIGQIQPETETTSKASILSKQNLQLAALTIVSFSMILVVLGMA